MGWMTAGLALCLLAPSASEEPKNMAFAPKLTSVAVFRDGFGYFVREGKVKLENGWATTSFMPRGVRGTIWVYPADPKDTIDTIVATQNNRLVFADAKQLAAQLANKAGLTFEFVTQKDEKFSGELAKVDSEMALLKSGSAFLGVPLAQVKSATILGHPIRIKVASTNPNKVATIGFAYMQESIRWEPGYLLDLDEQTGTLTLRATIHNTIENLDGCSVQFVVGSPMLALRGQPDEFSPTQPPPGGVRFESADSSAIQLQGGFGGGGAGGAMGGGQANAPVEAGELAYYVKEGLALASGDVALTTLSVKKVPLEQGFEWNADIQQAFYVVNITNNTGQPLPSGPVMALEQGRSVGQGMIGYTANGAKTELRLAQGIGSRVEETSVEVSRGEPKAFGEQLFIPIVVRGELSVHNGRASATNVKVTKTLHGKILKLSEGCRVLATSTVEGSPNGSHLVEWTTKVAAGSKETLTYEIERLQPVGQRPIR